MANTVNFADLQARAKANPDPKYFTDGTYLVAVHTTEWGITSTGKPKIKLRMRCVEQESPSFNKTFTWNLTLSEEKPAFFLKRLATLGATEEFLANAPSENDVLRKIAEPRNYQVTVKNGTYQGRETIDVVNIRQA